MTTKKQAARKALVKKGMSIGALAMRAIMDGKDVDATLALVKKEFPKGHTTRANILWYRAELRRRGEAVPALPVKRTEGVVEAAARRVAIVPPKRRAKAARRAAS